MLKILATLKNKLSNTLSACERYFLGEMNARACILRPKTIFLFGADIYDDRLFLFTDDTRANVFQSMIVDEVIAPRLIFVVAKPLIEAVPAKASLPRDSFVLMPQHIEEVKPMADLCMNDKDHLTLLVLCDLSLLPSNETVAEKAYGAMLKSVFYLRRPNVVVVVVDNEMSIGEKNSALLRRLFHSNR